MKHLVKDSINERKFIIMDELKNKINHWVYGKFEDGTGVFGKVFNVKKVEETTEEKPYYELSVNLGNIYCVVLDTREITNLYDFTETYSNEKNKFEDFGIDSTMNNVEIMDEIIQNWNAYEEEEKKNLSSLVRSQMDDDTIMEFMNKVSNLITETEHLNHKIRRMELASCCLIGEPAGVLTFNHSIKEDED